MNKLFSDPGATHPMSAESVNFKNGMIVTADDLSTAMHYPVALMQTLNKAVYGCGVVCGFKLEPDPELCGKTGRCDPCDENSAEAYPNFVVEVGRGTALDCYGLPIELCKPMPVDVSPETCGCDEKGGIVCLFIRRVSASEAPRGDCCAQADVPADCSRQRDHVLIKAFPQGQEPEHACMRSHMKDDGNDAQRKACSCLMECDDCECCGDGWVLLGCIELSQGGIVKTSLEDDKPYCHRKWIKTIEYLCRQEKPNLTKEHEVSAQSAVPGDDSELQYMRFKDKDIATKIESIVSNEAHRKLFGVLHIQNTDHFIHVLETRMEEMKALVQFSRSSKNLDDYLAAARSLKDSGRTSKV